MNYQLIIRPEAAQEIQESFDWFEERSEGLGLEFVRSADASLTAIERNPLAFPVVHKSIRRSLLKKFPYAFFYVIRENRILVLACIHARRDPITWMNRD